MGNKETCPDVLQPILFRQSAQTLTGLAGINLKEILSPAADQKRIYQSMANFAKRIQETGQLREWVNEERKIEEEIPQEKILLFSHEGGRNNGLPSAFYFDADYGFALFLKDDSRINGACVSFHFFSDLNARNKSRINCLTDKGMNLEMLGIGDILITQLQGPTYSEDKSKYKILPQFRWEIVLVELVIRWAKETGLPRVFMLPAKFNSYINHPIPNLAEMLKIRYDVTARRCGLKKPLDNGPYVLDFRSKFGIYF